MVEAAKASFLLIWFILLGTLTGGFLTLLVSKYLRLNHAYINVFCGGLLMGILILDLIPETLLSLSPLGIFIGISAGILLVFSIDRIVHQYKHNSNIGVFSFVLLISALYLHSVPTGIALGLNMDEGYLKNSFFAAAIILHHIPEGVIIMAAVIHHKMKPGYFAVICLFLSFIVGVNFYWGLNIKFDSLKLYTLITGAAIGTLCYVTFYEILWKSILSLSITKVLITVVIAITTLKVFMIIAASW